jgi:hypothetical protein
LIFRDNLYLLSKILLASAFSLNAIGFSSDFTGHDPEMYKLWIDCSLEKAVTFKVFNMAMMGYRHTDGIRKKNIITIIDFSKESTKKRFYVIDIDNRKLLYHCLVAHGKNSGEDVASSFSNKPESLKSSLGFYLTAETYSGKHGYSLRLNGLEKSINDNARSREIVIHGADYVSQKFIDTYGRLGRSWGCPALPPEISKEIIDRISNGSCLFIYGRDDSYKENSSFIQKKN